MTPEHTTQLVVLSAPHQHTGRSSPASRGRFRRRGFTLLEAALATVILGVGVVALIEAHTTLSRANDWSTSAATGSYLANELRERMRTLSRHDPVTGLYIDIGSGGSAGLVGWGREGGELTVADFDDLDDYDALTFGSGGNFPGPIDAQGNVINTIDGLGAVVIISGQPQSLQGWSQSVLIEKVDPFNFGTVRARDFQRAAAAGMPALAVDKFPLRVTVTVRYQSPTQTSPSEISKLVWIAPP